MRQKKAPKEHVYKIGHKFAKSPHLMSAYGFSPYQDDDGEMVIAAPLILPADCGIVKNTKRLFERFRKDASDEEREADFSRYSFNEDGTVVMTEELTKEWTECQICFYADGVGRNQLFINAPDHNQYFNSIVLDECAPGIVARLLGDKVIYKALVK